MPYLEWLVAATVVLFPATALTIKGAANKCLYLLVIISLVCIAFRCKPMGQSFSQVWKKYWPVHLAMSGTVLAIFLNQAFAGSFHWKTYDVPFRLAFFAPITWLLLLVPLPHLRKIQWGIAAGTFAMAIKIHLVTAALPEPPTNIVFINRIPYGDIALLLGIFSFLAIGWSERKVKWETVLNFLGGCAGVYTSYFSQTRGGWVAIPVLAAIVLAFYDGMSGKRRLAIVALVLVLLGAMFSASDVVQLRVAEAGADISQYMNGKNVDTSIGIRFQLWRGSWILFTEHPWFGVGREHFYPDALSQLHARNIITATATHFGHSHSEFFFNIATLGIFGLISFLAIYTVPGYYFLQAARAKDAELRIAGSMGVVLCVGYFVFGLTEAIFNTPVSCAFFSMNAAVFFAYIVKRKQMLLA